MLKSLRRVALMSVMTLSPVGLAAAQADGLNVVASFSIIGDFAKNVGGDRIDLTTLVGPDGDAHVYEPKPADAGAMATANVVLVNGLHFEGFLQRLVEASGTKATVVELTKGVTPIEFKPEFAEEDEGEAAAAAGETHDHGNIDPHAFQSIANAKIYVQNIADAFCAADADWLRRLQGQCCRLHAEARRPRRRGEGCDRLDPGGQAHHHHLARCVRLFRARIRPDVPRAGRHLDGGRSLRPPTSPR